MTTLSRASTFARLAKVRVYHHWTPVLAGFTLVPGALAFGPPAAASALLWASAFFALAGAGGTLDDVQGKRDGLDDATYGSDEELRRESNKPLVRGEVSVEAAERFGWLLGLASAALGLAAVLVAPAPQPSPQRGGSQC